MWNCCRLPRRSCAACSWTWNTGSSSALKFTSSCWPTKPVGRKQASVSPRFVPIQVAVTSPTGWTFKRSSPRGGTCSLLKHSEVPCSVSNRFFIRRSRAEFFLKKKWSGKLAACGLIVECYRHLRIYFGPCGSLNNDGFLTRKWAFIDLRQLMLERWGTSLAESNWRAGLSAIGGLLWFSVSSSGCFVLTRRPWTWWQMTNFCNFIPTSPTGGTLVDQVPPVGLETKRSFSIELNEQDLHGGQVMVWADRNFYFPSTEVIRNALTKAAQEAECDANRSIVIDLANVQLIDHTALKVIVSLNVQLLCVYCRFMAGRWWSFQVNFNLMLFPFKSHRRDSRWKYFHFKEL